MNNKLRNGKREMDEMHKDRPFIQERVFDSPQSNGSVPRIFTKAFSEYVEKKRSTVGACDMSLEYEVLLNALNDWLDTKIKPTYECACHTPSDSSQGVGSALIDLQESVDFLRELQSEWAWKRNTIKKNNREMAELDELVARIDRRLKSNS